MEKTMSFNRDEITVIRSMLEFFLGRRSRSMDAETSKYLKADAVLLLKKLPEESFWWMFSNSFAAEIAAQQVAPVAG